MPTPAIQGPGLFLAQFLTDQPPYDSLASISQWAASLGYRGVQIPTWDTRVLDLSRASESQDYCDEQRGVLAEHNLEIVELASYLQGQVMAMHPAYEQLFQPFYPAGLNDTERVEWATQQLKMTVDTSVRMGTTTISVLSGGLAWPYLYPWPQRSAGLIEEAFGELVKRWLPVLNYAQDRGVTFGYELHPGSDLFDGATYERFLALTREHPAAGLTYDPSHLLLQQSDYLQFIEIFHERIRCFHVKDAEFRPTGLGGVYGSYHDWPDRPGRFRSLGDGQVDFNRIFSLLTEKGYTGWAVLEWECCVKSPEQGAREGAAFIRRHLIERTDKAFDDFAAGAVNPTLNKELLGINTALSSS